MKGLKRKMKKSKGKTFEIPQEVLTAWVIEEASKSGGIGISLLNKYNEIRAKYPDFFKNKPEKL